MKFPQKLKSSVGLVGLKFLYGSNRWNVEGENILESFLHKKQSVILVTWHGPLLGPFMHLSERGYVALAGTHKDADLISQIGQKIGWDFTRGSSTRKGVSAFKSLVKILKNPGTVIYITPDGPKGPQKVAKPGAVRAAQLTGVPIIPVIAHSTRSFKFINWDTFYVTKPFARMEMKFGEPLLFDKEEDLAICLEKLHSALNNLENEMLKRVMNG